MFVPVQIQLGVKFPVGKTADVVYQLQTGKVYDMIDNQCPKLKRNYIDRLAINILITNLCTYNLHYKCHLLNHTDLNANMVAKFLQ